MGLIALAHVESSHTRDWTHVPWIGRQILNHCTTREVLRVSVLGLPSYQVPFPLLCVGKGGECLRSVYKKAQRSTLSPWSLRSIIRPCSQRSSPVPKSYFKSSSTKSTQEKVVGCPLITSVPWAIETLVCSYHTQCLSVSHITSHEMLLLTSHKTLSQGNNLNPTNLFPLPTDQTPHHYLALELTYKKYLANAEI